ncbi:NAD(P)-binding protein [Corynespora cassiicola Philippines]|uniref:NAD(P)-binding protein n=1 Tax=Corynespora cassiicola Philippines TaxID=1448308 RepID=A0A2T2NQG8_CORCC|nr:NAD(P)-binding protein [Corynespora cassiicola Philippines]
MGFSGKAYIVTGAASGMGKATVQKLLGEGAIVHAIDLSSEIPDHGETTGMQWSYPIVDISSRDEVKKTYDLIFERSPQVSGLVNSAGIFFGTPNSPEGDKLLRKLFDVNVMGTWNTNTEFYQHVKDSRSAGTNEPPVSIVNLGSMASVRGIVGMSGYVASKHAVLGLSRTFTQDWGKEGFRVNTVAPGAVRTPMAIDLTKEGPPGNSPYSGALKSISEPEELANAICFLLGDESSAISGLVCEVNGGWP